MLSSWDCFVNRRVKSVWLSCESLESDDDEIQGRVLSTCLNRSFLFEPLQHTNHEAVIKKAQKVYQIIMCIPEIAIDGRYQAMLAKYHS